MLYLRLLRVISLTTAVLCTLWFSPSLLDPFNIPKLAILIVGAAPMLVLLLGYVRKWWLRETTPAVAAAVFFLACMTAAALASDQSSYRTLWGAWARNTGFLAYAALVVILLAVAVAFRGDAARYVLYGLLGVGVVNAIYGTFQTTGNDPIKWNNGYNPIIGTVGNPNFSAALMGIAVVVAGWIAADRRFGRAVRITGAFSGLYMLFIVYRTDSLQGLLVAAIGLVFVLGAWLTMHTSRGVQRLVWPLTGLSLLGGVAVILGALQIGPTTKFVFQASVLYRSDYYAAAIEMMKRKPLLGVGLDSYGDWFRLVRSPIQVARRGPDIVSNAAHNVVLQLGATAGIITMTAYLLLSAVVIWRFVVAMRNSSTRMVAATIAGAWLAFFAQSLVSIDQLGLAVWGWMLGGAAIAVSLPATVTGSAKRGGKTRSQGKVGTLDVVSLGSAAIVSVIAVVAVSGPLSIDSDIRTLSSYQVDSKNPQQTAAFVEATKAAAERASDPYWRAQLVNNLYRAGQTDAGVTLAKESAKVFPKDVTLWNLVAIAYEQTGRKAEAIEARAMSVKLDPLNDNLKKLLTEDEAAK